jgi:hypothetical protein
MPPRPGKNRDTDDDPLRAGVRFQSRCGITKNVLNGADFAEDIEAEEYDLRVTLKQTTEERTDFAKGLVFVKEYEAHSERLRVKQDKLKVERQEEKRKDLQVV